MAENGDWFLGSIKEPSGLMEMFYILFAVVVSSLYTYENALSYIHLRSMHFTAAKLTQFKKPFKVQATKKKKKKGNN